MPLEDLVGPNKFLDSLVPEWPLGIDPFAEGDDHIRGVKNVLANSFPSVGEARRPVSFREGSTKAEDIVSAMELPAGSPAQRPAEPVAYDLRVNTDGGFIEWWDGNEWVPAVAMLRENNVHVGQPGAPSSPLDQWSANKVPAAGDIGPSFSFNTGDGPGGINMGSLRWQISPDDVGRHRLAVRRNNQGFGNPLVVGGGVMVPMTDNPPDSFDPGRGFVNAEKGFQVDGWPVNPTIYEASKTLTGTLVKLIDAVDVPQLVEATTIRIISNAARGSNGSNPPRIRLSTSQSPISTGYEGASSIISAGGSNVSSTDDHFGLFRGGSYTSNGRCVGHGTIMRYGPAGNLYMWGGLFAVGARVGHNACMVDIGGTIDAIYAEVDAGTMAGEMVVRLD